MYMENLRGESAPEGKSLFHVFLYRLKKKRKKKGACLCSTIVSSLASRRALNEMTPAKKQT